MCFCSSSLSPPCFFLQPTHNFPAPLFTKEGLPIQNVVKKNWMCVNTFNFFSKRGKPRWFVGQTAEHDWRFETRVSLVPCSCGGGGGVIPNPRHPLSKLFGRYSLPGRGSRWRVRRSVRRDGRAVGLTYAHVYWPVQDDLFGLRSVVHVVTAQQKFRPDVPATLYVIARYTCHRHTHTHIRLMPSGEINKGENAAYRITRYEQWCSHRV